MIGRTRNGGQETCVHAWGDRGELWSAWIDPIGNVSIEQNSIIGIDAEPIPIDNLENLCNWLDTQGEHTAAEKIRATNEFKHVAKQ